MTVIKGQFYSINSVIPINISGATIIVKYKKPDLSEGEILASLDISSNTITATVTNIINDAIGRWIFWIVATYNNGIIYKSKTVIVECIEEGSI
jgi:hypothetical protein